MKILSFSLLFLTTSLLFFTMSFEGIRDQKWVNRVGNQRCTPHLYCEPTTLEDLQHSIQSAASQGYAVRAIGSGYSISDIGCTNGCLLSLKHLNRILSIDMEKKQVRVETGITLQELNQQLALHGLALSNHPAIAEITLGGAISTAVHGTGHTGTLSSFIREIELITADGAVHAFSQNSNPEAFAAASVSLGSLGVIYAVTLQCEPLFYLETSCETMEIENFIENYKNLHHSNDFLQFSWNIDTGVVEITTWNRLNAAIQQTNSNAKCIPSYEALAWYTIIENDRDLFSEVAVPIDSLPSALKTIKPLVQKFKEAGATMFDISVRFVDQDEHAYLSPASEGPVAYIVCCITEEDKYLAFYKEFEEALRPYNGRPHWGKVNFLDDEQALNLYGTNFQKFIEVKKQLDPEGVFSNPFTNRLFETPIIRSKAR